MTKFQRLLQALKTAFVEDKCQPQWDLNYIRNLQIDNIKQRTIQFWLKGGTPDVRKTRTDLRHRSRHKVRQSVAVANPLEWLDIFYKGRMVQINGKGKIRGKKTSS